MKRRSADGRACLSSCDAISSLALDQLSGTHGNRNEKRFHVSEQLSPVSGEPRGQPTPDHEQGWPPVLDGQHPEEELRPPSAAAAAAARRRRPRMAATVVPSLASSEPASSSCLLLLLLLLLGRGPVAVRAARRREPGALRGSAAESGRCGGERPAEHGQRGLRRGRHEEARAQASSSACYVEEPLYAAAALRQPQPQPQRPPTPQKQKQPPPPTRRRRRRRRA